MINEHILTNILYNIIYLCIKKRTHISAQTKTNVWTLSRADFLLFCIFLFSCSWSGSQSWSLSSLWLLLFFFVFFFVPWLMIMHYYLSYYSLTLQIRNICIMKSKKRNMQYFVIINILLQNMYFFVIEILYRYYISVSM